MKKILSFFLFALTVSSVFAGGYRISIQGQKQLAMGHTGVAVVNSAEVSFFNPAGMAFLEKRFNFSGGASFLFSNAIFQNKTYDWYAATDNPIGTPFNAYATYRIIDWITFGLALYTPFGSSMQWPTDWPGSHLINNISLKAIFVQPTISLRANNMLSIGGGPIYVRGTVDLNRNLDRSMIDEQGDRTDITLKASDISAWGYTLGFMFNPSEDVRMGVSYRSRITMSVEGNGEAYFEDVPLALQTMFSEARFGSTLPLPAELSVGISWQATDRLLFAFDLNRHFWSEYRSLDIDFSKKNSTQDEQPSFPDSENPRNYRNASTYRIGAQYIAGERFTFRTGFYYDESPVADGYFSPETPSVNTLGFTGGLTCNVTKNIAVDASFLYLHGLEREASYDYFEESGNSTSFSGQYKTNLFAPGIGITYHF